MVLFTFFLIGLTVALHRYFNTSIRLSVCLSLEIIAILVYLSTEGLSLFRGLDSRGIGFFWLTLTLLLWAWILFTFGLSWIKLFSRWKTVPPAVGWVIVVFGCTGVSGILYAPNNMDSMVYHLPRIVYWLQHGSLDYFAVQTDRILYQSPLTEYMMMAVRVLDGTYQTVFFIQWIYGLGAVLAVGLLAEALELRRAVVWVAMCLAGLLPILIVQSSSTKNDVVIVFFVLMTFYFVWLARNIRSWSIPFAIGVSIGLTVLTKGTSYIYLLPICLYWLGTQLLLVARHKLKIGRFLLEGSFMGLMAVSIFGLFFYRNLSLTGSPLGVSKDLFYVYNNEIHHPIAFLSVLIKNISLHGTVPGVSYLTEAGVIWLHENVLRFDVHSTAVNFSRYSLPEIGLAEDTAGNFLHVLLLFPAIYFVVKKRQWRLLVVFSIGLASFFLFCFLVKWQLWHTRLHLPMFFLFCIPIAYWMVEKQKTTWMIPGLGVVGILYAIFCFFRPIICFPPLTSPIYFKRPKIQQYYTVNSSKAETAEAIIVTLQREKKKRIGIAGEDLYGNFEQFPFMNALESQADFFPILVSNATRGLQKQDDDLDAILLFSPNPPATFHYHRPFRRHIDSTQYVHLYLPDQVKAKVDVKSDME